MRPVVRAGLGAGCGVLLVMLYLGLAARMDSPAIPGFREFAEGWAKIAEAVPRDASSWVSQGTESLLGERALLARYIRLTASAGTERDAPAGTAAAGRDLARDYDAASPAQRRLLRRQLEDEMRRLGYRPKVGDIRILSDFGVTFKRLAQGVFAGVLAGFLLGLSMGCFTPVESFFMPTLSFLARIPPTAMMTIYFPLLGVTTEWPFIAIVTVGIFPTLAQSIHGAVRADVSEHVIFKSYTLGASHLEVIWDVIFKQVLPRVLQAIQLHLGPALVFLIAAEAYLGDEPCVGYRLQKQSKVVQMNVVYTYLVVLGISGLLLDGAFKRFRRWLCPWFGE